MTRTESSEANFYIWLIFYKDAVTIRLKIVLTTNGLQTTGYPYAEKWIQTVISHHA